MLGSGSPRMRMRCSCPNASETRTSQLASLALSECCGALMSARDPSLSFVCEMIALYGPAAFRAEAARLYLVPAGGEDIEVLGDDVEVLSLTSKAEERLKHSMQFMQAVTTDTHS
jgi:hypothetical protein